VFVAGPAVKTTVSLTLQRTGRCNVIEVARRARAVWPDVRVQTNHRRLVSVDQRRLTAHHRPTGTAFYSEQKLNTINIATTTTTTTATTTTTSVQIYWYSLWPGCPLLCCLVDLGRSCHLGLTWRSRLWAMTSRGIPAASATVYKTQHK